MFKFRGVQAPAFLNEAVLRRLLELLDTHDGSHYLCNHVKYSCAEQIKRFDVEAVRQEFSEFLKALRFRVDGSGFRWRNELSGDLPVAYLPEWMQEAHPECLNQSNKHNRRVFVQLLLDECIKQNAPKVPRPSVLTSRKDVRAYRAVLHQYIKGDSIEHGNGLCSWMDLNFQRVQNPTLAAWPYSVVDECWRVSAEMQAVSKYGRTYCADETGRVPRRIEFAKAMRAFLKQYS